MLAASFQPRCCFPGRHWSGVATALPSGVHRPRYCHGKGSVESTGHLVLVSCLHFLLPRELELVAPENPRILGRSCTTAKEASLGKVSLWILCLHCILMPRPFLLCFHTDKFHRGLSHLPLLCYFLPPLSLLNLCSLAKRHSAET